MEPISIAAGAALSLLIALRPNAPVEPNDLFFSYSCRGLSPAAAIRGLTTLQFTASSEPAADVIALATTSNKDGIVSIEDEAGVAAFAVSAVNLGTIADISVSADTGSALLPVDLQICATDPRSGACVAPPANSAGISISSGATPTFSIFVSATDPVVFDPAVNRIFVKFTDHNGIIRGSTSVAVRTNQGLTRHRGPLRGTAVAGSPTPPATRPPLRGSHLSDIALAPYPPHLTMHCGNRTKAAPAGFYGRCI